MIEPGGERVFLAPLPLDLLEPSPVLAATLARWGIHSAGELARLPRIEVALRLGQEGVALHRLACGETDESFIPDAACELLREGTTLEHPIAALETFLFVLHGILSRLARRLELRGEGFAGVAVELSLEGSGRRDYQVKLVAATGEIGVVLAIARLQLEAHPPGAAVEGITVQVAPGRVRLMQGSLFAPPMPSPGKLATTLARLAALVGPERVGAPLLPDTHLPTAWAFAPFSPAPCEGSASRPPVPGARCPALRAFRPPREAQVTVVRGRPVAARMNGIGGVVVGWAGPYRFVGEWWGDRPFARDDYDLATADGSLWRVYFDRLEKRWYADGVYD